MIKWLNIVLAIVAFSGISTSCWVAGYKQAQEKYENKLATQPAKSLDILFRRVPNFSRRTMERLWQKHGEPETFEPLEVPTSLIAALDKSCPETKTH